MLLENWLLNHCKPANSKAIIVRQQIYIVSVYNIIMENRKLQTHLPASTEQATAEPLYRYIDIFELMIRCSRMQS